MVGGTLYLKSDIIGANVGHTYIRQLPLARSGRNDISLFSNEKFPLTYQRLVRFYGLYH